MSRLDFAVNPDAPFDLERALNLAVGGALVPLALPMIAAEQLGRTWRLWETLVQPTGVTASTPAALAAPVAAPVVQTVVEAVVAPAMPAARPSEALAGSVPTPVERAVAEVLHRAEPETHAGVGPAPVAEQAPLVMAQPAPRKAKKAQPVPPLAD